MNLSFNLACKHFLSSLKHVAMDLKETPFLYRRTRKNTVFDYKNTSKVNSVFNMALSMHLEFEKRSLVPNPSIVHGDFS